MNILEIASTPGMNGAVKHCWLVSRELAKRGHRVVLACRPDSWIQSQVGDTPLEVVSSEMRKWSWSDLRSMAALIRDRKIDVIHTHLSRAHVFGVLLRKWTGVPCVASAQSRHMQFQWRCNDLVLAASDATREFHQRYSLVPQRRIRTVHNFVDLNDVTSPTAQSRADKRRELGLNDQQFVIGIVGAVLRRKGLVYLVQAVAKLAQRYPQLRVVVVGGLYDPAYTKECQTLMQQHAVADRFLLLNTRSDVSELLHAFDLFTLPTLEDTLPLSLLEAMAAGLPAVCTRVGGIPDCIEDGETGLLVAPRDAAGLAEALRSLIDDPEQQVRLGRAGQERIRESFSTEHHLQQTERAFRQVVRQDDKRHVANCLIRSRPVPR